MDLVWEVVETNVAVQGLSRNGNLHCTLYQTFCVRSWVSRQADTRPNVIPGQLGLLGEHSTVKFQQHTTTKETEMWTQLTRHARYV